MYRRSSFSALLALLILVVGASAVLGQVSGVTETKLPNGLVVLTKEVHAAPVFTAQVWFKVGSRNEHTAITGISHLLEHMLFNSSKNYKKGEITQLIRERGGIENAATWVDFTYYWQLLSSENLEFSIKTLAERVGNALLLKNEFANERTVVLSELEGRENDPDWLLYRDVNAAAFMAHPYHWPTIGWRSEVEKIDVEQLRAYYRSYYYPNNATLVLVGDFDTNQALGLVRKYFGSKIAQPLPRPVYTVEPPQRGERDLTLRREGSAQRVLMAYHIPALASDEAYPLMILDQVLSGGRSSRLYQALVDTQLATSAYSNATLSRDPGLFMLSATARQGVSADKLEQTLNEQVEKARTTKPTAEEVQSAKNQLEAYLIFQNDSVSDQGEQLGYYNTLNSWKYLETLIPKLKAVTPEQVQAVAAKYLVQNNETAGQFIPTGPEAGGGASGAPPGPVQKTLLPSEREGVSFLSKKPASASAITPPAKPQKALVKPTRVVLDNGIVVIVQENHSNPTVAISGNMKAGSYFDAQGKHGTAELVSDMVERGTKTRTWLQLATLTDRVGADVSVSAAVESSGFSARSLARDFPLMLDVLSDELRNASFPQDQFERAKGEALSRLVESKESTESRAFRAFYNTVYPAGHPYHDLTLEQAQAEITAITRDDLVNFYNSYYRPDTAIIVIAGDVTAADAVAQVRKYFGDWKATGPRPEMTIPTTLPQPPGKRAVVEMPGKSETTVVYGYPLGITRKDPDYYAVRIMNQVLGGAGALGSVLGETIREKMGLVYDVYSTFDATLGAGAWYASLGTAPGNVDKAVAALQKEVESFRSTGATQKQYERAREFIIGVFPIALETNAGVARSLLSAEFYGLGTDYLVNYPKIFRSVTLQQVNAAAKKYLRPDAATLAIAGDYKGK